MTFDPKAINEMFEQQRRFFEDLNRSLGPYSQALVQAAQNIPGVDPAMVEKWRAQNAAMEAAFKANSEIIRQVGAAVGSQIKANMEAAAAMTPHFEAMAKAAAPVYEEMQKMAKALAKMQTPKKD